MFKMSTTGDIQHSTVIVLGHMGFIDMATIVSRFTGRCRFQTVFKIAKAKVAQAKVAHCCTSGFSSEQYPSWEYPAPKTTMPPASTNWFRFPNGHDLDAVPPIRLNSSKCLSQGC
jgi:hypothetical protein